MVRDLRKDEPYLAYKDFDFKVICATSGDCFSRFLVRMDEMVESLKIVHQAIENLPSGPVNVDVNSKDVLPPKSAAYRSIEGLIQHFELIMTNRQWETPRDEVYGGHRVAQRRAGLLHRGRRQRQGLPGPHPAAVVHSFCHFPLLDRRPSDQRHCGRPGQPEHHCGGVGPMSVLSEEVRQRILAYLPRYPSKQAVTLPALHLVQDELRCVPLEAVREIADLLDLSPAEVNDTMTFYGFFRPEDKPLGRTRLWVCRSLSCMLCGGEELLAHMCQKLGVKPGGTSADGKITVEFAECIGACEGAPCVLINDEHRMNVNPEKVDGLIEELKQQ